MKRRYSVIFAVTAAAVLVSSIAYASKKKLQTKTKHMEQDMSEVELVANLLSTSQERQQIFPNESYSKKHGDEELKDLTMLENLISPDKGSTR